MRILIKLGEDKFSKYLLLLSSKMVSHPQP